MPEVKMAASVWCSSLIKYSMLTVMVTGELNLSNLNRVSMSESTFVAIIFVTYL